MLILFIIKSKENLNFKNKLTQILPMSGSEPNYNPQNWNKKAIQKTHNCYAYMLDDIMPGIKTFPHPGIYGYEHRNFLDEVEPGGFTDQDTCFSIYQKIQNDIPNLYSVNMNKSCKKGFYKSFLTLDPKDDYHFYRQDSNGRFSHKPGKNKVTNKDSKGDLIYRPDLANKRYSDTRHYTNDCQYFCVPVNTNVKYSSLYTKKK